jgi:hypothetical protein
MSEQAAVSVAFIKGDDDGAFLTTYMSVYPNYRVGDTIWLEVSTFLASEFYKNVQPIRLTRFEVVDIQHCVHIYYGASISQTVKIEVYLKESPRSVTSVDTGDGEAGR